MGCEKSMKLYKKKKKSMKYWRIGQIQKTEKVKMLETITTHIDIVKFIERGKKMLNAKLERHLTRPHTLPYDVFAYIYIYIYID